MATRKKLSKTALSKLRDRLVEEHEQLQEQARALDEEADIRRWRDAGFDDDPADTGSANVERERAQSLALHARRLMVQIEDALKRMDHGTYGVCERCGEPIEAARLDAIPYATLCLEDKRRDEHGR